MMSERLVVDPFHTKRLVLWMMLIKANVIRGQRHPSALRIAKREA